MNARGEFMEPWIGIAIVIVLGVLAIDRSRACRLLPGSE